AQTEPPVAESNSTPPSSVIERARRYVATMEPAISGNDGHGTTFHVACVLSWGFALSESDAWTLLCEYNQRCQPPWSEKELQHKLDDVPNVPHEKQRGHLIGEARCNARTDSYERSNREADEFDPEPEAVKPPFIDLGDLVRRGLPQELPRVAEVFNGRCLLYAGRLNEIHGEPSVGKTNVACALVAAVVRASGNVIYLDPEDTPQGIAAKLTSFGLTHSELTCQVGYLHNPEPITYAAAQRWAIETTCHLVVCDGLAEALAAEGLSEDKPLEVLPWFRRRLRPFAEAGAAVLVSDPRVKKTGKL